MGIPVGINGFGRIGRVVLRIILERGDDFDLCGINLRKADLDYMEYMVKYDSVFHTFQGTVEHDGRDLIVNGHRIRLLTPKSWPPSIFRAGQKKWSLPLRPKMK